MLVAQLPESATGHIQHYLLYIAGESCSIVITENALRHRDQTHCLHFVFVEFVLMCATPVRTLGADVVWFCYQPVEKDALKITKTGHICSLSDRRNHYFITFDY